MKFEALKHAVVIVQRTIVPQTIKFDLFCLPWSCYPLDWPPDEGEQLLCRPSVST